MPRKDRCGSFKRVLWMFRTGTLMRSPVPSPRVLCLMSGFPPVSSGCGLPISGKSGEISIPPSSNTRKTSPGWRISQRGSGNSNGYHTFAFLSLGRGWVHLTISVHPLTTVAFPKRGRFERPDTVIVGCSSPETRRSWYGDSPAPASLPWHDTDHRLPARYAGHQDS